MSNKHITSEQRNELSVLLRTEVKQKDIAEILGKTSSAISQEIQRNSINGKYHARIAKEKTKERRIEANQRFRKIENNQWIRKYITRKLKEHWSPEQISGRIKTKWRNDKSKWIGKDSIYEYIYSKRKDLVKYLRCKKGKYRRRRGTRIREKQREEAKIKRIDKRPGIVERRNRTGDWEGDTIVGKDKKKRLLTNIERKSGYGLIDRLLAVRSDIVHEKLRKRFGKISDKKKFTYTYDNGTEIGKEDGDLEKKIKMEVFRAFPYHSWERGSNENFNGLIREFFPKNTDFAKISKEEIKKVESFLNNRPRKRLNYYTPREVFFRKNS